MRNSRVTQRSRLLAFLRARPGQWIPLPEILSLGFAQFGARLLELRRDGHLIVNKTEHRDGKVLSWYKLVPERDRVNSAISSSERGQVGVTGSLFGDISPNRTCAQ